MDEDFNINEDLSADDLGLDDGQSYQEPQQPQYSADDAALGAALRGNPAAMQALASFYAGNNQPQPAQQQPATPQMTDAELAELQITDPVAFTRELRRLATNDARAELLPQVQASTLLPQYSQAVRSNLGNYYPQELHQALGNAADQFLHSVAANNPAMLADSNTLQSLLQNHLNAHAYQLSRQGAPRQPVRSVGQQQASSNNPPVAGQPQRPQVAVPNQLAAIAKKMGIPPQDYMQFYNQVQRERRQDQQLGRYV
jgi:hypothetical protein